MDRSSHMSYSVGSSINWLLPSVGKRYQLLLDRVGRKREIHPVLPKVIVAYDIPGWCLVCFERIRSQNADRLEGCSDQ